MSRIRSVHPGLFTDEAFMSASVSARLLIIGLWVEAWDDGVFEWKPLTLKARIFPVDHVDMGELLTELEALQFVCRFKANEKEYGAIRNFRKWQKPKIPNSSGVLPEAFRKYVGLKSDDFSNASPKPRQREDGGGMMEDGIDNQLAQQSTIPAAAPAVSENETKEIQRRCEQAAGRGFTHFQTILTLVDQGVDLDRRILPIVRDVMQACTRQGKDPPTSWKYFEPAILDHGRPVKGVPPRLAVNLEFVEEGSPEYQALMVGPKASFFSAIKTNHPETGKAGVYRKREAA